MPIWAYHYVHMHLFPAEWRELHVKGVEKLWLVVMSMNGAPIKQMYLKVAEIIAGYGSAGINYNAYRLRSMQTIGALKNSNNNV